LGVTVGEERVRIVDRPGYQSKKDVEADFGSDQDLEVRGQSPAAQDDGYVGNDVLGYFGYRERENGYDHSEPDSPRHDNRPRLPEDSEDGGHIPERSQPLAPWALSVHKVFQVAPK